MCVETAAFCVPLSRVETRNQFLGFLEAKNVALRPSEASTQGFDLEKKRRSISNRAHVDSFPGEDGGGWGQRELPDLRASRAQGQSSCVLCAASVGPVPRGPKF